MVCYWEWKAEEIYLLHRSCQELTTKILELTGRQNINLKSFELLSFLLMAGGPPSAFQILTSNSCSKKCQKACWPKFRVHLKAHVQQFQLAASSIAESLSTSLQQHSYVHYNLSWWVILSHTIHFTAYITASETLNRKRELVC